MSLQAEIEAQWGDEPRTVLTDSLVMMHNQLGPRNTRLMFRGLQDIAEHFKEIGKELSFSGVGGDGAAPRLLPAGCAAACLGAAGCRSPPPAPLLPAGRAAACSGAVGSASPFPPPPPLRPGRPLTMTCETGHSFMPASAAAAATASAAAAAAAASATADGSCNYFYY